MENRLLEQKTTIPLFSLTFSLIAGSAIFSGLSLLLPEGISYAAATGGDILAWLGIVRAINGVAAPFPKFLKQLVRWAHAISFEIVAIAFSFFIRPYGYLPSHKKRLGASQGTPILLIHGYLHNSSAWFYLRKRLAKENIGPVYLINLQNPFLSITGYAKKVAIRAQEIEAETGKKDLILIGHSMGGLVAAEYAFHLAPAGTIKGLVTIGSPLNGTSLAKIALGPNGKEMRLGSSFIQKIQSTLAKAGSQIRCLHFGTTTDQLVIPSASAFPITAPECHFAVEDIGHLTLLYSPRIALHLAKWLKSAV